MPLSHQARQRLVEFNRLILENEEMKEYPDVARLWNGFLSIAYAYTRFCYGDAAASGDHIKMVQAASSFKQALAAALKAFQQEVPKDPKTTEPLSPRAQLYLALRKAQPASELQLLSNLAAIGLPQHTAARDLIQGLNFVPLLSETTPVPSSGIRPKESAPPASGRRFAAAVG